MCRNVFVVLFCFFEFSPVFAQDQLTFPKAIAEAETLVFGNINNLDQQQQLDRLIRIVTFVNGELGGSGSSRSQGTVSSSTSQAPPIVCVPCPPPRRGLCNLFRRSRVICEPICVDDQEKKRETKSVMQTVLRENSRALLADLLAIKNGQKPTDDNALKELARQAYSLAVIAKEPFTPGSTKNGASTPQ